MADKSPEQITIETLNKENATLKKDLLEAQTLRNQYAAKLDELKPQHAALQTENAALKAENTSLGEDLDKAESLINEQTKKLANAEAAKDENSPLVVTHEDVQYRVLAKQVKIGNKVVKADELAASPELLAQLIASGSGLLQEIEAK
ncbi:hypothetical protein [Hymenobacter crusticola]|uniref:Uncharacterized protein n=1 Tax=Hymenobacter crusticola TaxID=1770526 RepID=A0A243W5K7_9BACT|nr:hypothetical protein [Hymenobacter crusticola]OUJ68827.1 hypothetical protein BXP70_27405 [Hymenobacter crusticola]